ncbi:MAG: site-specific integrase [Bacteroidia bacterium]|nr:site-specific integrase [Bacteroidia bacterium]
MLELNRAVVRTGRTWYLECYLAPTVGAPPRRVRREAGLNRIASLRRRREVARIRCAELQAEIDSGALYRQLFPPARPTPATLALALAAALEVQRLSVRPRSAHSFTYAATKFLDYLEAQGLAGLAPAHFTRPQALLYLDALLRAGLSPTTRNHQAQLLRSLFNRLIERGLAEHNPFAQIRPLREEPEGHLVYTQTQQTEIVRHLEANHPRLHLLVAILYYTLARPGEVRRLPFRRYDLRRRRIHIPGPISKNGREAYVGIPDGLMDVLLASDFERFGPDDYPFSTPQLAPGPRPCAVNAMMRAYRQALAPLDYGPGYTLYSWKHTGAVRAVEAGVQLKDLQLQLRHASLDQVDRYLRGLGCMASEQLILRYPRL